MALFIAAENQNIIWEMINKVPLCNVVFPLGSQNNKNNWFKNIIQEYYNRSPPNITRNDLYKINRDVLSYMVKQLGELERTSINQSSINKSIDTRDVPTKTNMSEFEIRQSQYKNMFEIQKPQTIDFSEKIDDDVITNMDELIENHKKMREHDLQELLPIQTIQIGEQNQFTPLKIYNGTPQVKQGVPQGEQLPINELSAIVCPISNIHRSKKDVKNMRVNITDDVPKEAIQSIIIENDTRDMKKEDKHVRFTVPENNNYEILENKLDILVDKFENMESKIVGLYNILDNLYTPLNI